MEEVMCCDMQLVSLLADDVTKEKDRLRLELLNQKRGAQDIPLSMITLTPQEKRDCFEKAFTTITSRLPEETRSEYRREIRKLLASRKSARKETREAILAGTNKKKPCPASPIKKVIVIEDTSKAIQMELFKYVKTPPPWFKSYMDQP